MKGLPIVVLVGRTNVGKSSLFNRLSTSARSITYDVAGVTRDFITDEVAWRDRVFELVDTGGLSFRKSSDVIQEQVKVKAREMIQHASLLLFVVDPSVELTAEDFEIASELRKQGKPIIVVANKMDTKQARENRDELAELGFETIVDISAIHGKGINELFDAICAVLPAQTTAVTAEPGFRVVFLGKPNVGKSSLMNLLLNQERSIVTPQAGTTREPISERITFYQEDILLTDTPGIRRKRSIDEPLETLMVRTSFKALDAADIVLLLIDESAGELSDQELKLAFYAFEHHKALIILYNKDDIADQAHKKALAVASTPYEYFLDKVPSLSISCKTGKNIGKILPLVQKVWAHHNQRFINEELNLLFKEALREKPLYHKTQLLKLHTVKQIGNAPITLLLIVNVPQWFGDSQCAFFEKLMRDEYDLKGAPIKFVIRKGG